MKLSKYMLAVAVVALIPLSFAVTPARAQDDEEELVPETVSAPEEEQTVVPDSEFVGPPAPETAPATEFVGPPAPQQDPDSSLKNALVKDDTSDTPSTPRSASLLDDPNRVVSDVPDPLMQNILTAAQTGDGLAQNDNIVRGLRAIPGGNPSGPALDADLAALQRSADTFRTAAAAAGGQVAGPAENIGSTTRPSGIFSSTPDVSIGIDGKQESISGPPTSRGDTTTFYRVPQPGGSVGVEARNASGTYTLQYTNGWFGGRNYSWSKK